MTRRASSPVSPTRPDGSCRWSAPSTARRCWPPSRRCSAWTSTRLDRLALSAPAGAEGLTLVPYFEGERSPNLPEAAGALHGVTTRNLIAANVARAAVEGLLASMAYCIDKIAAQGVDVQRIILVGGGARSEAVRRISRLRSGCTRARADARRVRRAGRGQAGGMDAVTTGFAAVVVVRGRRRPTRRTRRRRCSSSTARRSR